MSFLCPEWEWREKGGSSVPVYSMARSGGTWTPHSLPGLPQTGQSLQPPRRWTHCGPLQVTSTELSKHIYIQSDMTRKDSEKLVKVPSIPMKCAFTLLRVSNHWPKLCWLYKIGVISHRIELQLNCLSLSMRSMIFVESECFILLRHNKATLLQYIHSMILQINRHRENKLHKTTYEK